MTVMLLTLCSRNIPVLAPEGFDSAYADQQIGAVITHQTTIDNHSI